MMKSVVFATALSFLAPAAISYAEQTPSEKASAKTNDAKRKMKKDVHRVQEVICAEGDVECAAKKAKHRGQEAGDYMKDKAEETKDKAD